MSKENSLSRAQDYARIKAKAIMRIPTKDGGRLHKALLDTLVEFTIEEFKLDYVKEQILRNSIDELYPNLTKEGRIKLEKLPDDWKEVIKPHTNLTSLRQLGTREINYHKHYCSEKGCRFGDNETCKKLRKWLKLDEK